jgi:predicted DNA-binding protein
MSERDEKLLTLQIRIPPELMRRIDTYRLNLTMRPTRSQYIRFLLENAMTILEEGDRQ